MLNVAETTIEAFVKPYLATHGGFPDETPAGLSAFEAVALVLLIVGAACLAVAVFRARVLPVWVAVLDRPARRPAARRLSQEPSETQRAVSVFTWQCSRQKGAQP
jgi:hypothetical protein